AVDSYGAGFNIGYPISDTSRLSFGLSVQQDEIKEGVYTVQEIQRFLDAEGDSFFSVRANLGWSQSTLNRGVFPDRGYSQNLGLEVTVPGSDLHFYKLGYRGQRYFPITDGWTLRVHTDSGVARRFGSTDMVPFYEHYFAGGIGSVRGFECCTLRAKSALSEYEPDKDRLPFGCSVEIAGGLELIRATPCVQEQRLLRTVLFRGAGHVCDAYGEQPLAATAPRRDCADVSVGE